MDCWRCPGAAPDAGGALGAGFRVTGRREGSSTRLAQRGLTGRVRDKRVRGARSDRSGKTPSWGLNPGQAQDGVPATLGTRSPRPGNAHSDGRFATRSSERAVTAVGSVCRPGLSSICRLMVVRGETTERRLRRRDAAGLRLSDGARSPGQGSRSRIIRTELGSDPPGGVVIR